MIKPEAFDIQRKAVVEALGTGLLVATVVGSGIMGDQLAQGNTAIALMGNTLATGAMLVVLILIFGQISGAHFNPAVSLVFNLRGGLSRRDLFIYCAAQIAGGIAGTFLAHAMFDLPLIQIGSHIRSGPGIWLGETVASFGLVLTILSCLRTRPEAVPYAVGLFIMAGYWFTSSTSFANPAVTVARALTDTFSGVRPADVPWFIIAQTAGALLASGLFDWLVNKSAD